MVQIKRFRSAEPDEVFKGCSARVTPKFAPQSWKTVSEHECQRAQDGGRCIWAWPRSLRGDASAGKFREVGQMVQVKAQ